MQKSKLLVTSRTVLGRKVKSLRRQGQLPANIYGKKVVSNAVQVATKDFTTIVSKSGEAGLLELTLNDQKIPALIHNIQYHPVTGLPLHVDFFQVDLKEKVTSRIPLVLIGESRAVKDKIGVLLSILTEVEVSALPADLPEKIEVDISNLTAVDQVIKVLELKVNSGVKILTDKDLDVVKLAPLVSKEAEKMAKEEAEAKAAAVVAAAPVPEEGAVPTDQSAKETTATPSKTTSENTTPEKKT